MLLIGSLGKNFSGITIKIHSFIQDNTFENVACKIAAIRLGLNVLTHHWSKKCQVWMKCCSTDVKYPHRMGFMVYMLTQNRRLLAPCDAGNLCQDWVRRWFVTYSVPSAVASTSTHLLSIGHSGPRFNEILSQIQTFSFKKMHFRL